MKTLLFLFGIAQLPFLDGCVMGHTTMYHVMVGNAAPGVAYQGDVLVFMDDEPLPPVFEEVAIVQTIGQGYHANLSHAIEGLRRKAAALGCNAIIRVKIDQGVHQTSATAVAIRLPKPGEPSAMNPN